MLEDCNSVMLFFGEKVKATTDPDKKAMQVKKKNSNISLSPHHQKFVQERQFATMKSCIGELEMAVKKGKQEEVDAAQQTLLAEGIFVLSSIFSGVISSVHLGVLFGVFSSVLSGAISVFSRVSSLVQFPLFHAM